MKNGTIYSILKKRYIGSIGKDGYLRITKVKGYNHSKLHLYIWMIANQCDIPKDESGRYYDIHHIDGNKQNNSIYNLQALSKYEHHLLHIKERENNPFYGKKHSEESKNKMSENRKDKKKVGQYTLDGELIKVWDSICECKKEGFNKSSISKCCNDKLKTYKGYKWKLMDE